MEGALVRIWNTGGLSGRRLERSWAGKDLNDSISSRILGQRIRQTDHVNEHFFSIEFLDDEVQAYSFTFWLMCP